MATIDLKTKIASLPQTPGVYLWKNAVGDIIYVGKAKRLRRRVESYHRLPHTDSPKTARMVSEIADLDWIETPSEADALILEETLIKRHRPKYNVALVHSLGYPYVKITTSEPFPRLLLVHTRAADADTYLGPYTDPTRLRTLLEIIRKRFFVRTCTYNLPVETPARPCLEYHIKKCKAPCVGYQSRADYRSMITSVTSLLSGEVDELVSNLKVEMQKASDQHAFERAADIRDQIKALSAAQQTPVTALPVTGDRDVFGLARDAELAVVVWLKIRQGRMVERDMAILDIMPDSTDSDILTRAMAERYLASPDKANHLVFAPSSSREKEALLLRLSTFDSPVKLRLSTPSRGSWHSLFAMATTNAQNLLDDLRLSTGAITSRTDARIIDLQRELGLPAVPRAMVCFDISHGGGRDTVASVVRFTNGQPDRALYRTYAIKTVEGIDDFASIREVVARWAARVVSSDIPAPDLIVIDGGQGQLSAAAEALKPFGLSDITMISLAKREEEIFSLSSPDPIRLSSTSPARLLLQEIRDETHRTAVSFHRKKKNSRTVSTTLSSIPGLGPTRVRLLLKAFGSVSAIKASTPDVIAKKSGIPKTLAQRVHHHLTPDSSPAE